MSGAPALNPTTTSDEIDRLMPPDQQYSQQDDLAKRVAPTQTRWPPNHSHQAATTAQHFSAQPAFASAPTYQAARQLPEAGTGRRGSSAAASADRPGPHRAALIAGALVVCVAVAIAAFVVGAQLRNTKTASSATTANDSGSAPVTTVPARTRTPSGEQAGTTLPQAFVGDWKGVAKDGLGSYDIVLTLNPGIVGEQIGESTNTGRVIGLKCNRAETLTSATGGSVTLTAALTSDGGGCNDDGATSQVDLQPDGRLSYRSRGVAGDMTGILTRTS